MVVLNRLRWQNRRQPLWLLGVLISLGACTSARPPVETAPEPAQDVTLEVGDVVEVKIWREEELSGRFTVDENGVVTFPLLGERVVTEIPVGVLREQLVQEYRVQLRNPSIKVTPLRKILVLGAVNRPGPYEVTPITNVLGVIALAGGATSAGDPERVRIDRDNEVLFHRASPGATLTALQLRSGDQIVVGHRNWLQRNQSFVVSVLLAIPSVIYTITRIGN
jgi:polysaccharide export outer membrane protein